MINLMDWAECEEKFVRTVETDSEKIKSIVEIANSRLKFIKGIKLDKGNVSFVFEGYYEVIKELLVAVMLKNGLRSKNHQCLFTFFNKEYGYEQETNLILQMSYLRNRLDYYGEKIDYDYVLINIQHIEKIITLLNKLIKQ